MNCHHRPYTASRLIWFLSGVSLLAMLTLAVRESERVMDYNVASTKSPAAAAAATTQHLVLPQRSLAKQNDTTTTTETTTIPEDAICVFTEPNFHGHFACVQPHVQAGIFLTARGFPEIHQAGNMLQSIQIPENLEYALDVFPSASLLQEKKRRYTASVANMPKQYAFALAVVPAAAAESRASASSPSQSIRKRYKLDYASSQKRLREAMNPVAPRIMTKDELEAKAGRTLPWAREVSIRDTLQLDLESPERRAQRVIYFISPTHNTTAQMVDFTRLKQTLQLASLVNHELIYWIVIEDEPSCTQRIRNLLEDSGVAFAHDATLTLNRKSRHKGLDQRHRALEIVRSVGAEGVIYFGDDDNAYDTQLFTELPYTRKVSFFGVGFVSKAAYERCQVDEDTGKIVKIHTNWVGGRKFPMDMAGFAFSTASLLEKNPHFDDSWVPGYLESFFLKMIADNLGDFDPLAAHCTRILAWHTRTGRANQNAVKTETEEDFKLITSLL